MKLFSSKSVIVSELKLTAGETDDLTLNLMQSQIVVGIDLHLVDINYTEPQETTVLLLN